MRLEPLVPLLTSVIAAAVITVGLIGVSYFAEPWRFEFGGATRAITAWGTACLVALAVTVAAISRMLTADRPGPNAFSLSEGPEWIRMALTTPLLVAGLFGPGLSALLAGPDRPVDAMLTVGTLTMGVVALVMFDYSPRVWLEGGEIRIRGPWQREADTVPRQRIRMLFWKQIRKRKVSADVVYVMLDDGSNVHLTATNAPRFAEQVATRVSAEIGIPITRE